MPNVSSMLQALFTCHVCCKLYLQYNEKKKYEEEKYSEEKKYKKEKYK
jgi:hypothetical protein